MAEDCQPRKLRLLVKGKEKVDSLFRRKKKAKQTEGRNQHTDEDDFEHEVPILSRIADPAGTHPLRLKLKVNPPMTTNEDVDELPARTHEDKGMETDTVGEHHERAVKAERRRGIIGMDTLNFNTKTIVSHNRAIAKQPSPLLRPQQFTFVGHKPATSTTGLTSGLQTTQGQPTESQLQQAARDVFLESKPKPEHVSEERLTSQQDGITIKQFLDAEDKDGSKRKHLKHETPKTARPAESTKEPQARSSKGPLDHLKLNSTQPIPPPRLDTASPVTKPSNYVSPQIETPEAGPALYRSNHHNPTIPHHVFSNTVPDRTESLFFAQDAEDDAASPRRTVYGDVPALNHRQRERVPLGARIKDDDEDDIELNNISTAILPKTKKLHRHLRGMTDENKIAYDESRVPQTYYTAPNRLPNAYLAARRNLKRKRRSPSSLPLPDHIHRHTGSTAFNIFTNGILLYPELCLLLAAQLPVQTLINLYSISKDFHVIVNQRFTTVILNQLTLKAPHAARCYPWRCYERLCQPDPSLHAGTESLSSQMNHRAGANINIKPAPPPTHAVSQPTHEQHADATSQPRRPSTITIPPIHRKVPTFRYLHLALHREKTLWQIYQLFAAHGVPLPGHPSTPSFISTLHKLWFLLDIPDNPRRIAYTHSPTLFTPSDLSNTLVFIVKLDMLLNDPVGGEKRDGVRKMLLSACDGLGTLRRVLQRRDWTGEVSIIRAWTRYGLQLGDDESGGSERAISGGWVPLGLSAAEHAASSSVFGIPRAEVGLLKREFWGALSYDRTQKKKIASTAWGRKPMFLIRPDQLVLREAVRRKMVFRKQFLRALLFGYVDEESEVFERMEVADYNAGRSPVLEAEGEYEVDDVVAGVRALSVQEGGDELLDLGESKQGSPWTVRHCAPGGREMGLRREEKDGVRGFMEIWREEVRLEREEERRLRRGFRVLP
ncbi:hypothetical protein LTR70_006165 [Exophiala xenobiotica]|uniref:Uncharacterized protein n=1 Tax=Lithohypha guttulata TaxID=1690604 RepID=A0ABR0K818_9EURO|nr:hypothetical protein LTR24_005843 [Lithohypha guttulata]KAK5316616.1 hypothetical protein LTR70_006165 [Exophiala xenobiotica]